MLEGLLAPVRNGKIPEPTRSGELPMFALIRPHNPRSGRTVFVVTHSKVTCQQIYSTCSIP